MTKTKFVPTRMVATTLSQIVEIILAVLFAYVLSPAAQNILNAGQAAGAVIFIVLAVIFFLIFTYIFSKI